jgi:hypothetical protein
MAIKDIISKIKRSILCCSRREEKCTLDIVGLPDATVMTHVLTQKQGAPTNVRRVDVFDALPGLTDAQRKYIREKASSDAIHLLGLQSRRSTDTPTTDSRAHFLARYKDEEHVEGVEEAQYHIKLSGQPVLENRRWREASRHILHDTEP